MKEKLMSMLYREYVQAIMFSDLDRADMMFSHLIILIKDRRWWQLWK